MQRIEDFPNDIHPRKYNEKSVKKQQTKAWVGSFLLCIPGRTGYVAGTAEIERA